MSREAHVRFCERPGVRFPRPTHPLLGIRLALRDVEFADDRLVHALLVHELERAVVRTFGHAEQAPPEPPERGSGPWRWPAARSRNVAAGCAAFTWMCCTCQFCCRDPFPGPWSGQHRVNHCDCDCCDCCSACDCDCCDCSC